MGQRFAGLGLMDRGSGTITERTRLTRIKAATGAALIRVLPVGRGRPPCLAGNLLATGSGSYRG